MWGSPTYTALTRHSGSIFTVDGVSDYPVKSMLAQFCCNLYEVVLVWQTEVKRRELALLGEHGADWGTLLDKVGEARQDIYTIIYHFEHAGVMLNCI